MFVSYNPSVHKNEPLYSLISIEDGNDIAAAYVPVGEDMREHANKLPFYYAVDISIPVEEKQLPIDDPSRENILKIRMRIFDDQVDTLAEQLFNGDISIGQWEEDMKGLIRGMHSSAAAIGKGGWDNMTFQDWGRIGPEVRKQYRWLHNFAEYIAENKDSLTLKAIQARARLYGEAAGHSNILMQAAGDIIGQLPYLPRDGSTECMVRCKCHWSLAVQDVQDGMQIVSATWKLSPAEHCATCLDRNGNTVVIQVPVGVIVPSYVGGII